MFTSVEDAVQDIKNGKMVIVLDDENRENEGDLVISAKKVSSHDINFMITKARGLICAPLSEEIAKRLNINLMVEENKSFQRAAFTISVDINNGGTGISTADRAATLNGLADKGSSPNDFIRPGHIFPLISKPGGVLQRAGHTEAAIDLMKFANLPLAAVLCEVLNEDGTMARRDSLLSMAKRWNIKLITVQNLIEYRKNFSV